MGFSTYNPFKGMGNYFKNLFKPQTPNLTPTPSPFVNQQNNLLYLDEAPDAPTSYQIKSGDTFASIGQQYGLSESDIQKSSNMTVPPPKGSYISLPRPGFARQPQVNAQAKQLINQGVPPSVAAQMASASPTSPTLPQPGGFGGANSFTSGLNVNMSEMTFNYQNQIANGIAPKSVPTQVLASLGATPQSMAANGYVLNPNNGMWELGGTGGAAPPANQPDSYSEVRSVYYSRSRGWVTPDMANRLRRQKRRRMEERKMVAGPTATNAGLAPVTSLDVRMGSG